MRLSDRPIVNAILGVAFALVLLGFLAWPALASHNSSIGSIAGLSPSKAANSPSPSSPSVSTTVYEATATSQTSSGSASGQGASSPLNSVPPPNSAQSSANSGTLEYSADESNQTPQSSGISSTITTIAITQETNTTVIETQISNPAQQQLQNTTLSSSTSSSLVHVGGGGSSTETPSATSLGSGFNTLTFLSASALVIAVGSMFLVYRRIDANDATES